MDQFSVSLDFPDERHDDFRCYPGLYRHLEDLIPRMARLGHDDIVLNSCITSENLGEINAIADKAREWGVNLCYSAYSARRTGCRDFLPASPEQLAALNQPPGPRGSSAATTPTGSSTAAAPWMPRGATSKTRGRPVAKRAIASWWSRPMALCSPAPCSSTAIRWKNAARMIGEFTRQNRCDECYVSIRSYLDKSFPQLLWENVRGFFSVKA